MKNKKTIYSIRKFSWLFLIIYLSLGWNYPKVGLLALLCMLAPPVVAVYKGNRFWCGFICPRGSFNDNLLKKVSLKKKIPNLFKSNYLRIFALFFLFSIFFTGIFYSRGEFNLISLLIYRIVLLTTIIAVILGTIFDQRIWCAFCPMGSLSALMIWSKRNIYEVSNVNIDRDKCNGCNLCREICPLSLKPYAFDEDKNSYLNCIDCKRCRDTCPKKALK